METNIDIDSESDMGHFGWEELFGGFVIPYIIRREEKFSALQIFSKLVAHSTMCISNDADLLKFDDVQTWPLTQIESYLLNEINHMHCDGLYDHTFKSGDKLVELNVIRQMAKFIHDCQQKINFGIDYDLDVCGILCIRMEKDEWLKEYLVPYVRLNCMRYVPFTNCEFYNGTPRASVTLTSVDLQYMKFMHKVLHLEVQDIAHCISFEEIVKDIGPNRVTVNEYWPENQLDPSSATTIRTIDLSDESSSDNQNDLQTSHAATTTGQQASSMCLPPQFQQLTVNANEPQTTVPSETEIDTNGDQPLASKRMSDRNQHEISIKRPKSTKEGKKKQVSEIFYHNIVTKTNCLCAI